MSWEQILTVVNILISLGMTLGLAYVARKTGRIDTLEERLEERTDELIQARMNVLSAEVRMSVHSVAGTVSHIEKRLEHGDEKFDQDGAALQKLQLHYQAEMGTTKNWIMEKFALKEDLKVLEAKLVELQVALASKHITKVHNN